MKMIVFILMMGGVGCMMFVVVFVVLFVCCGWLVVVVEFDV